MIFARVSTILIFFGVMFYSSKLCAQSKHIIGPTTEKEILETQRLYQIYFDRYQPDSLVINYLRAVQDSVVVNIFLGDWCRESTKYIPQLMKALSEADNPNISTNYFWVDPTKENPRELLARFDISHIPTTIIMLGHQEIGRIEERPLDSMEEDLVDILKREKR